MRDTLPDDPWHAYFNVPAWLDGLIAKGALGQKTKGGIFRKQGKAIQVFDPASGDYRDSDDSLAPEVDAMLKMSDPAARLSASAHLAPPAGAIPVGHLPRLVPLLRRATRKRCRQRARCRFRAALGLRLGAGAV
jgi:hypothetical protein